MADKPYINLDDDLIDDYQGASSMMAPPVLPPNAPEPQTAPITPNPVVVTASPVVAQDYGNSSARVSASTSTKDNNQVSDLSVALEQEMQDIEQQMYAVAVEGFNRKREQAHQDIDKLYDEMISVAEEKLRGITIAIAEEVGE